MAGQSKTRTEPFGARLPFWTGLLLAALAILVFYRLRYPDPGRNAGSAQILPAAAEESAARVKLTALAPVDSPAPAPVRRSAAHVLPLSQLAIESGLVGPDVREHEPNAVLINELFSLDPQVRMTAAIRLSRRSVYATEAVPILKKLAPEEPDPRVRQIMNEAILNIRGYAPPPFEKALDR